MTSYLLRRISEVYGLQLFHLRHLEEDNQPRSATLMTRWWEPLKSGSAMVVVVAVDEEAVKVVVVADLLQTLAELISAQSLMR
jgi:hypothetical protein